jgi:ParB family chromosome partitioning protein
LKNLHDEGWSFEEIARIACRGAEYIRQYIRLVENGEDRLIQGVEQGVIPITFAILVAQSDDTGIQNVLMDAFDQGIVNCENFAKARAIISARADGRKRRGGGKKEYTVATLKTEITDATSAKDSYVREVQGKERRLLTLLDGIATLWQDAELLQILKEESLDQRPTLSGTYGVKANS